MDQRIRSKSNVIKTDQDKYAEKANPLMIKNISVMDPNQKNTLLMGVLRK